MVLLLELVAKACTGSKSLTKYIAEGGALSKIAVQLTLVLEELNLGTEKLEQNLLKL